MGLGMARCVRWLVLAVGLLAAACAGTAVARTVLELDPTRQPVELLDWGDSWIDESGAVPVDVVARDAGPRWVPTQSGAIYPLATGKALWIRFTIPPAPDAERWYVEIPYALVNKVTLFTPDSVGQWNAQSAGDTIAVADWPVPHRHPLLPVAVSAEEPRKYLLRVENPLSFSAPVRFVSEGYLSRNEQQTSLILGIYFGLAGLAVVLGLLSSVSLRDAAYGLYALSVGLMALSQASLTGIAGLHLWPHAPTWNDLSPMLLPVLTLGSLVWFTSAVVSMPQRSPRFNLFLIGAGLLAIPLAAILILFDGATRLAITVNYVAVATVISIAAILWSISRGDRYALWVFIGTLPVTIGSFFPVARAMGLIPVSFLTTHGMQVGIAIELPILLVILMVRSQNRREHYRRIQGLDRMDPATGLLNAQVFELALNRMMARSRRLKYESAVLLIDIVNVEAIRRDFGTRSAEELPLQVAGRLLAAAREIDAVARLGEFRFGMLVEGPLTPEDAASEGPRIVARCLMPFKNKPLDWVAQVRVAQTMVPTERADTRQVIERLEGLLANVSPDSKRAVFTLKS